MVKKETKLCDVYSTGRTSLPAFGGVQSIVISADKDFAGMQTDVRFGGRHGAPGLGCLLYPRKRTSGAGGNVRFVPIADISTKIFQIP